ncbi:MAG: 3-methyl-2-oxobutanoate hydroxymethyltransferase, partial [Eubacteriaceae bacterium]|nr:3-methyl-2-oxobutanoate hydroxymethyltransferase [Eubacteriaceae bacterium]
MKTKITVPEFKKVKQEGRKLTMVTAFDYYTATIVDESDAEVILVGDSLGMIMLGYKSTTPVTMDEMIHHTKAVVKGAPNTFIIGDLPFGSYHESCEQAVRNSARMIKETGCDCVKLEGGIEMADRVRAIANAGIAVMGH